MSTDGGSTWHPASLTGRAAQTVSWTYSWNAHGAPSTTIETRAVDDSGNLEAPSDARSVNVSCPCSFWGNGVTRRRSDSTQTTARRMELGVKLHGRQASARSAGSASTRRSTNTGTHVGSLWTATGQLLASATFTNETASGWQTVTFSTRSRSWRTLPTSPATYAPAGHYSNDAELLLPVPRSDRDRRGHPTPARCTCSTTTRAVATACSRTAHEPVPDRAAPGRQLLGRRVVCAEPAARSGDRRHGDRRQGLSER